MPKAESSYPMDWFKIATKDLNRAELLLGLDDLEGAAFNIQQAAEKYLKAFLLLKGWKLRRIHDLVVLLSEAIRFDSTFTAYLTEFQKITEFYTADRYPLVMESDYNSIELEDSLRIVRTIASKIKQDMEK
jgi:HEPN domain-containing protein